MANYKTIIQYDGTKYRGWQRLGDSDKTIQGKIENVLREMTGEDIEIIGSGRTDAGVHALGQVANFHTECRMEPEEMLEYFYKYLPEDIVITSVEYVNEQFHARYHVKNKTYLYRVWTEPFHNPFLNRYAYHVPQKLDMDAMKKAAAYLTGQHDFTSFSSSGGKKKSMVREVYSIDIQKEGPLMELIFRADGFLYNMVRIMAGTMIEVGLGNIHADAVKGMLDSRKRSCAGPTAPAKGLFLCAVEY